MFEIHVESAEFRDKRTLQQHQMVNQVSRQVCSGVTLSSPVIYLCPHAVGLKEHLSGLGVSV